MLPTENSPGLDSLAGEKLSLRDLRRAVRRWILGDMGEQEFQTLKARLLRVLVAADAPRPPAPPAGARQALRVFRGGGVARARERPRGGRPGPGRAA
ncbi:MAG TPA: hypothetical protein VFR85_05310 [Anaeromyxobacteraceae bacterium]|nr:hypothetical protein [Anaeromyxobacteraceae bacterium]